MKKLMLAAAALAVTAAPIAASAQTFGHGWNGRGGYSEGGYRGGYRGERGNAGGAALAGGLLGFVLGAAVASNHNDHYDRSYYDQSYYGDGYGYGRSYQECGWRTQAVEGPYGEVHYERVEVCR